MKLFQSAISAQLIAAAFNDNLLLVLKAKFIFQRLGAPLPRGEFPLNFLRHRRHKLSSSMVNWRIKRVSNWQFHKENSLPGRRFFRCYLLRKNFGALFSVVKKGLFILSPYLLTHYPLVLGHKLSVLLLAFFTV
jgi:hypothetical protein